MPNNMAVAHTTAFRAAMEAFHAGKPFDFDRYLDIRIALIELLESKIMTCMLCGHDRPLKDSHFAPKHAYKRFGGMTADGTSLMMSLGGRIIKSSRQITQHLLCEECECRFSRNGEDYFAKIAMPNGLRQTPPMLFRILRMTLLPLWNQVGASRFSLGGGFYPQLNSAALYYYAISLFWRAGQDGWRDYEKMALEDGLMRKMGNFLLGGEYVPGLFVRVLPSFWREKYGFILPFRRKGVPFFSMYMYDFYLEECSRRFSIPRLPGSVPIIYTADSFASVETYEEMSGVIKLSPRAKALQSSGDLISW